jgi:hypothetical protein
MKRLAIVLFMLSIAVPVRAETVEKSRYPFSISTTFVRDFPVCPTPDFTLLGEPAKPPYFQRRKKFVNSSAMLINEYCFIGSPSPSNFYSYSFESVGVHLKLSIQADKISLGETNTALIASLDGKHRAVINIEDKYITHYKDFYKVILILPKDFSKGIYRIEFNNNGFYDEINLMNPFVNPPPIPVNVPIQTEQLLPVIQPVEITPEPTR